jgi:hypothetical protein
MVRPMRPMKSILFVATISTVAAGSQIAREPLAQAAKKAAACGITTFPLAEGHEWVFRQTLGVDEVRLVVAEVGPGKDAEGRAVTAIVVEETYKGTTSRLTWTCTSEGLRVPLSSFMWAGEPADIIGQDITVTTHKDQWMHPDAHVIAGSGWTETVKADVTRPDKSGKGVTHPPAKLELERNFNVKETEAITTPAGAWKAVKFEFYLRGRALLGADKAEIPAAADPGHFWFVRGVGPVKIEDNLNVKARRTWELISTNVTN